MKRVLAVFLILFVFLLSGIASVDDLQQAFELYQQKEFDQAAMIYERLCKGIDNPDLYYNLGNCYFKMGKLGHAILNYEKSLKRRFDRDTLDNLNYAVAQTRDQISSDTGLMRKMFLRISPDFFFKGAVILLLLCSFLTCFRITGRRIPVWLIVVLLIPVLLFFFISGAGYWLQAQPRGVILPDESAVLVAPGRNESATFRLHSGARVMIMETGGDWVRISLPNGLSGWINEDSIGVI